MEKEEAVAIDSEGQEQLCEYTNDYGSDFQG
jgi:hypothetical protein